MPSPQQELPKPMVRVLIQYRGRWHIGFYCVDDGDPGLWYMDGERRGIGRFGITQWLPLPPLQ